MDAREYERLAQHEGWYWWHRARERIVHDILRRSAPPDARVLDLGCGTGATTASLRDFGPVVGLDAGLEAVRRTREHGIPVARSAAARIPVRDASFDVVTALDVLEHLEDDAAAVREVHRSLVPGGLLLATVPAYPWLWSSHDVALGHQRRYQRRQLDALLTGVGFELEICSYVMSAVFPVAALVRLADRVRPTPRASRNAYLSLPRPVNSVLARVAALDGTLLRWLPIPFGLSIVALARRPGHSATASG